MKKKKIIFFQGTFDLLNAGHCRAIKLAKQHGNYLIIGLNTDELVRWFKCREPIVPFVQRKEILESLKWVDEVIPASEPAAIGYLKCLQADVYILTEEWAEANKEAIEYMKGKKVVFSPRFKNIICSSEIRKKLFDEFKGD